MYKISFGTHDVLFVGSLIYERDDFAASYSATAPTATTTCCPPNLVADCLLGNSTNRHDHLLSTNLVADCLYDKSNRSLDRVLALSKVTLLRHLEQQQFIANRVTMSLSDRVHSQFARATTTPRRCAVEAVSLNRARLEPGGGNL